MTQLATKPQGNTDLVTSRASINQAKQLAAALLPLLVERLGEQTMDIDDPEVTGKAIDRLSKLVGASDDKGQSMKPIIHFNISSAGAQVSVNTSHQAPLVHEVIEAEGETKKPVFDSPFVAVPSVPSQEDEDALIGSPLLDADDE